MNSIALDLRLLAACAIAREAGALVRARFLERDKNLSLAFKGPQDYITETDSEVEELIASRLRAAFPDDRFFGEEGGGSFGESTWIVDPIDGTADFARGVAYFCVSVAFVQNGIIEIGAIYDPMADELFAARLGHGATLNGQLIAVSTTRTLSEASVELGWSPRASFTAYLEVATRLHNTGAAVKRRGSGALGLAYVAVGRQDAYCELHINAWDAAAAVLIIREAGGWTNDFLTASCMEHGNRVLGCTPALRDALVAAMTV